MKPRDSDYTIIAEASSVSEASSGIGRYLPTPEHPSVPDKPWHKRATIADVAQMCGCSITTVSHVVNHVSRARVSKVLRERVEEAARQLNYQPSRLGKGLASRKTMMIAFVTDFLRATLYPIELARSEIQFGIQSVLRPTKYDLALVQRHKSASLAQSGGVDGAIMLNALSMDEIQPFIDSAIPLVVMEPTIPMPVPTVGIDEAGTMRLAVEHLIGLGHTGIGCLGLEPAPTGLGSRTRSYQETMARHGLRAITSLLFHQQDDQEPEAKVKSCLEAVRRRSVTAIACMTDGLAFRVASLLRSEGIMIPRDVSVVGIDGSLTSQICVPPLTTVYNPLLERGSRAAEMLLGCIENPRRPVEHITFGVSLIRRESSGPPASGN